MPTKDPRWAHYVDSALFGSKHGVECIVDFFGSDRVLFGTDTPFDTKDGSHFMQVTISDVEGAGTTKQRGQRSSRAMPANPRDPGLISTGPVCRAALLPRKVRQAPLDR
jgi:hypothetical protein